MKKPRLGHSMPAWPGQWCPRGPGKEQPTRSGWVGPTPKGPGGQQVVCMEHSGPQASPAPDCGRNAWGQLETRTTECCIGRPSAGAMCSCHVTANPQTEQPHQYSSFGYCGPGICKGRCWRPRTQGSPQSRMVGAQGCGHLSLGRRTPCRARPRGVW